MTVGANGSTSYTSRSDVQPVIVEYVSELLLDAFPNLQLNQHRIIDTLNQVLADYDVACAVRYGVTNSFSNPCNKILSFLLNRYQLPGRTKDIQYDPIDWYVYDYCYLQIKNHMSGYGVSYFRDLFDYKDEQKKVKTACTLFQLAYSEVVSLRSYLDWCYKNNKSTLEDILSKQQLNLYMRGHVTSEQSSLEEEDQ
jgi:hypothetical protein